MLDIATVAHGRHAAEPDAPERWRLLLVDGTEIVVRGASPADERLVVDLHERCSITSRQRRYLSGTRQLATSTLARLLSREAGHCLVAEDSDGRVVAMANLMTHGDSPEIGVLVEDAWQGRRIGSRSCASGDQA
jgi:hypothetical protein